MNDFYQSIDTAALTGGWPTAVHWAMNLWNTVPYISVVEFSGGTMDADTLNYTYGVNGFWGWGQCESGAHYGGADPHRWCYVEDVFFNDSYAQTSTQKQAIACHEIGHTLGLRHSNESSGSCMKKDQRTILTYSSHDKTMLSYY